jgi:hypothetical protein
MTDDYSEFAPAPSSEGELAQLTRLAEAQAAAAARVAELEGELLAAKETLKDFSEKQVPELMDQIGIAEFRTTSGLFIKVEETIRASIPKAKARLAFGWLKENGHAALIKRVVSVAFGAGEDEKADELLQKLADGYEPEDNAAVHPSTLSAFVRESLREGHEIPLDLLGVHRQRVAKIDI